jgi:poly-gamma-glutamate synthesis protein (capsule biosynthesis protein)
MPLIGLVGDVLVDRGHPPEVFAGVGDLLRAPDVLFANLEGMYTDTPHPAPSLRTPLFPRAHNLEVFAAAGFGVMSLANNHTCDAGHAALIETRARLRAQGVATCGAGEHLEAAREPAIVEVDGVKIAFLAYASVFPMGYEARSTMPGLAPLRAYDLWKPGLESYHCPGTPPRCQSVPDETDLRNTRDDIRRARERADVVIASFHWGDYLRPYHLTEHEKRTAKWCIDEGVDMVVGHHHHVLRGMEWYRGKPILYGLGHFVFDFAFDPAADASEERRALLAGLTEEQVGYQIAPRKGWPLLPFHRDARMTALAWASIDRNGVTGVGFVPCRLRPDGSVHAVDPESAEGAEVVAYVRECNTSQGLNGRIDAAGAVRLAGRASVSVVPQGEGNVGS